MLLAKAAGAIRRERMVLPGDRALVACSGGPDSMALLDALFRLRNRLRCELEVATIHHGLRSEAEAECVFVEQAARRLGLPCEIIRVRVARASQDTARAARLEALAKLAEAHGCNRIALGHTRSDQAETVLMRIVRGTALRGLMGIPPVRGPLVRPLLDVSREEVEEYLREHQIACVRDPSNLDSHYLRARLRTELLPILRRENPRIEEALAELARTVRVDHGGAERSPVRRPHLRALEQLLHGPGGTKQIDLGKNRVAEVRVGPRRLAQQPVDVTIPKLGRHEIAPLGVAVVLQASGSGTRFDPRALRFPLIVRTRRPGDRIRLPGGTRKISDVLIDAKVPRAQRDRVLLLCDGDRVLWIAGVARAAGTEPTEKGRSVRVRVESL